jgi:homoprotocatechuate degradation regulator HpaR
MQLMRVRELVMQRFRPNLNAHGLTDQQWRIIRALAEAESLEILEVSNRCCIHPASLSRILPKLEAEGYLSRRTNKEDQRRVIVSLTSVGRRFFETISPESEMIYDALEQEIGSDLLTRLYQELDAVAAALSNGAGTRSPRAREKAR